MSLIEEGVKQGVKEGARLCFGRLFTIINGSEALSTTTVEPIALRAAVRQLYCSNICRNFYKVPKLPFACKKSSFASVEFRKRKILWNDRVPGWLLESARKAWLHLDCLAAEFKAKTSPKQCASALPLRSVKSSLSPSILYHRYLTITILSPSLNLTDFH